MITIKTPEDIEKMKEGGKRLSAILSFLETLVAPGVEASFLNDEAERMVQEYGDTSAFLNYTPDGAKRPYPSSLCVSINDEIVHGVSNEHKKIIEDGDIVSLDMGLTHQGLILDSARSVIAGRVGKQSELLLRATNEALWEGIYAAVGRGRIGDIGFAVQRVAKKYGFGIAEGLAGHGVGYEVHEDPYVPNKGKKGTGELLLPGMVIAIEPMFCLGKGAIELGYDGYTYKTADGKRSAHFEHTVLITDGEPVVLTE